MKNLTEKLSVDERNKRFSFNMVRGTLIGALVGGAMSIGALIYGHAYSDSHYKGIGEGMAVGEAVILLSLAAAMNRRIYSKSLRNYLGG
ncbi:MAG: hypothetical protein AABW88_01985 [Nanoarchaeota archaeon]